MRAMPKHERATVTVLLSGGIDSSACAHFYLRRRLAVHPLFVDYGQPAAMAELESAKAICRFYRLNLRTISIAGMKIPPSGEITGRNLMLISCALVHGRSNANLIAIGIHSGTAYFDCGPAFARLCSKLLDGYADGGTQLAAPFLRMTKSQIWTYCEQSQVPLQLTWSCESSSKRACGNCLSCKDKESLLART